VSLKKKGLVILTRDKKKLFLLIQSKKISEIQGLNYFYIINKTQKLIIAIIAGFLAIIIPYYLFLN
jgi:hypothetical protein